MQTEVLADRARSYIAALALPAAPARDPAQRAPDPAAVPALAVGQNLVEFADGAAPGLRPAIADALLLAQLAADKAGAATPKPGTRRTAACSAEIGFRSAGLTRTAQDFSLHQRRPPRGDPARRRRGLRRRRGSGHRHRDAAPALRRQRKPALDPAVRAESRASSRPASSRSAWSMATPARRPSPCSASRWTSASREPRRCSSAHARETAADRAHRGPVRGGQRLASRRSRPAWPTSSPAAATPISPRWRSDHGRRQPAADIDEPTWSAESSRTRSTSATAPTSPPSPAVREPAAAIARIIAALRKDGRPGSAALAGRRRAPAAARRSPALIDLERIRAGGGKPYSVSARMLYECARLKNERPKATACRCAT